MVRETEVVQVVVDAEISPEQITELVFQVGGIGPGGRECRTCGLVGVDLRLTGQDPEVDLALRRAQHDDLVTQGRGTIPMGSRAASAGCPAIGVTYEGGDPALLERLMEVADYLEVAPDFIATGTGDDLRIRREILGEWQAAEKEVEIVAHGVGLSIGSASGWNEPYLRLVDELANAVSLRWHSEHLGYTTVDGEPLGTMLSLPRTEEALDLVCERVIRLQVK